MAGLTFNLGRLSPSIFTDSSLNIGMGAAPSGTYKFEVTGTAKISGVATFGSTLSNGTYSYTLPSDTGTLALTSALSSYVPYSGATGAVNLGAYNLTVNGISVGKGAGTGALNTAIGYLSLSQNTTGYNNLALGAYSLSTNSGGIYNAALGYQALISNTSGSSNVSVGSLSMHDNTTGQNNTAIGTSSGYYITTGSYNTIVGNYAGATTLDSNVILADGNGNLRFVGFSTGNVYLGAGTTLPTDSGYKLDVNGTGRFSGDLTVGTGNSVKSFINSTSGSYGQFQIGNPTTNDEATMVFISGVTAFGTSPTSTSGNSYIWGVGAGAYGIGGNYFAITNVAYGGPILKLASTGAATFSSSVLANQILRVKNNSSNISFLEFERYSNTQAFSLIEGNGENTTGWLKFYTSDTPRLTILGNGNVGIGITPSDKFQVNLATNKNVAIRLGSNNLASIGFVNDTVTAYTSGEINFATSLILSGGNVLIGTSTDNGLSKLQIDGGIYAANLRQNSRGPDGGTTMYTGSTGGSLAISNGTNTVTINRYAYSGFAGFVASNTEFYGMCNDHEYTGPGAQLSIVAGGGTATIAFFVGSPTIQGNGAYQAPKVSYINSSGTYVPLSDRNKKKDFEESTIGLNAILGLKPTLYRMKTENNTEKHLGFIAQEVKDFIPQAYEENGNFIGLQDRPIIAALVNAIKELKLEIDTLKNK